MFLRRLIKWILGIALSLAILALAAVWGVFGVNPFERSIPNLWNLVSIEADFYVQFPAARLLDQSFLETLSAQEGYSQIADLKAMLRRASENIANEVNPQIPLGLFQVDLRRDFLEGEMAFAGRVAEYGNPRVGNFVFLARGPLYARFLSALRRGFVRSKIPGGDQIEVVAGQYFRVRLPAQTVEQMRSWRATTNRPEGEDVLYFGRVADVLLMTDNRDWMEHALRGGEDTLPALPAFDSEFSRRAVGGMAVEAFAQQYAPMQVFSSMVKDGSPLAFLRQLGMIQMLGHCAAFAAADAEDTVHLRFTDLPPPAANEGFSRLKEAQQRFYNAEKGDLRYELTENGIGRFIPRDRLVAAAVISQPSENLPELVYDMIGRDTRQLLDDTVRERSGAALVNFERFLALFAEDLADTFLIVATRPTLFDKVDFSRFYDPEDVWPPTPQAQTTYTVVAKVKDSVAPDKVREKFAKNLAVIDLDPAGPHASGKFHLARLRNPTANETLIEPCFGAFPEGMKYVLFSSSPEAALAVIDAAENPGSRLIADETVAALAGRLPLRATLALVMRAGETKRFLLDAVRDWAFQRLDIPGYKTQFRADSEKLGKKPTDAEVEAEATRYVDLTYPSLRRDYERSLVWLDPFDTLMLSVSFGVGANHRIEADAWVTARK